MVETLVTPEMEQAKGQWSEPQVSPPIALSDIRKWAIAVYWPETPPRIFWDEEYAKTTRYGGIVAPEDFNPFAWPVQRVEVQRAMPAGKNVMNGGQVDTFGVRMRPGDVISSTSALTEWNERTTRLGLTIFAVTETRWTNQNGELVKTRRSTLINY